MSSDPQAKLFYGYIQQAPEDADYEEHELTPWEKTHAEEAFGCVGSIYGYSRSLGHFLAVEESLSVSEWNNITTLSPQALEVQPDWNERLAKAVAAFGLDIDPSTEPQWYLVSLYF